MRGDTEIFHVNLFPVLHMHGLNYQQPQSGTLVTIYETTLTSHYHLDRVSLLTLYIPWFGANYSDTYPPLKYTG